MIFMREVEDDVIKEIKKDVITLNKSPKFYQVMSREEDEICMRNTMFKEGESAGFEKGIEQGIEENKKYNVPIGVDTFRRREPINCTQVEGIKSLKVDTNLWVL